MLLLSKSAIAEKLDWLKTGEISYRPAYQISNQPIVDPQGNILSYTDFYGRLYGLFKLQKSINDLRFVSQLRPRFDYTNSETFLNIGVDEFYADYKINQTVFVSLGKRNIFNGVGLGNNFTDYFGENKKVDDTLKAEYIRDQRVGDYMATVEWFLDSSSLAVYFAPRIQSIQDSQSRLLLRYNKLFQEWNTDVTGYLFMGQIPGLGLNFSNTINDNWIVYSELSLRKNRDREILNITSNTNHNIFVNMLIGTNYTFTNDISLYLEYWHQGSGFDKTEWNNILNATEIYSNQLNTMDLPSGNAGLGQINSSLRSRFLRQNYLFSRVSYPVGQNLDLSLVHILNLDDTSQFIRALVEKEFADKYYVAFQVEQMLGHYDQEFAMRNWSTNVTLTFKVSF